MQSVNGWLGLGTGSKMLDSMLCSECKAVFDHWYDRDLWATSSGLSHHHIIGLQESSQNGCSICKLFLSELSDSTVNTLTQDYPSLKSFVTVFPKTKPNLYSINLVFRFGFKNRLGMHQQLMTMLDAFPSGKRLEP
jgi:hypothetical protein